MFFAGVAAAYYQPLSDARWLLVGGGVAAAYIRRQTMLSAVCIVCLCFGVGWWRGSAMRYSLAPYTELAKTNVILTVRASEDGVYGEHAQLTFTADAVHVVHPHQLALPGAVSIAGFGVPAVYRGDTVQVTGKLYPRRGNVQAGISYAKLIVLERGASPIDALRRKFGAGLQSALPEPLASFGLGLLIGQRSTLPKDVADVLVAVGLTHIIAVSGYNLTIIIEAARRLFSQRSKFQMLVACLMLMITFLLLTGSSPSIVRASIISMLSIFCWYYGRAMKPVALLLLAAAITVVANPLYLWGNVSWYLSFLAFFGVVVVAPPVTRRLFRSRAPRLVPKMLVESLCAEVMTLPYVLYIFGQMSLVSLPANVLVAAFVPLAMLLCAVAGVAGMIVPFLAGWLAWPARWLLAYMLDAATLLSRIPHAFVEHIGFSLMQLLVWYGIIGAWLTLTYFKDRVKHGILTEKNRAGTEGVT